MTFAEYKALGRRGEEAGNGTSDKRKVWLSRMVTDISISGNYWKQRGKRGWKDGVCLQEGDGMHCDRRASQTLLASWWLHCTLETETNRAAAAAAGSILFNRRLSFFSLTLSPLSIMKAVLEPLCFVQTNTNTFFVCFKTDKYHFPWPQTNL